MRRRCHVERVPLADRVKDWLWITVAVLVLAGAMYGTWHR